MTTPPAPHAPSSVVGDDDADLIDRLIANLAMTQPSEPNGKRILIVDDEPSIVRLLKVNLERQGYSIETAENGVQALAKIMAAYPDLLISDVMMPEMDGLELVEHVRRHPALRDLPIVLLTQKSAERDVMNGYARGADVYLNKPFNPAELILVTHRLLFRGQPDHSENGADPI